MAKDIFEFQGSIKFNQKDIDSQIKSVSDKLNKRIGEQVLDFKVSKDSTKELKNFADSIKNMNADMDLSKLNEELSKLNVNSDQVKQVKELGDALEKLNKSIKPKSGENLSSLTQGLIEFSEAMKDYDTLSQRTVDGVLNITDALKEFQGAQGGVTALNKLGTAMKNMSESGDAFTNLADVGDALGNLQAQIKRYVGTNEALAIPVRFKVEAGDFGKVMEKMENLDIEKETAKLQSDLQKVQEAVMDTATGFGLLGEASKAGLDETGHTLANALQLATNLGIIMRDTEQAKTEAIRVTQDIADAKGVMVDVQAESIKAQQGSERLWGQLDLVINKASQMERAFTAGDGNAAENYFNQLVKSASSLGSTITEVETAYSRILDAGGTLSQRQLSELQEMKGEYDSWIERLRDVKGEQEALADSAAKIPQMFKENDQQEMKAMATAINDITKDMESLKDKTQNAAGEFTGLLDAGGDIIRVEEKLGQVLSSTSIEAQNFREQARGIQEELNQIKGDHFDETFVSLQEVAMKTDETVEKFTQLREELRNTEADSRYLTQLHNGVRDINNELLIVEQTIAKMEKGGGFMAGDIESMEKKKRALQDLLKDYESMSSRQEAFAKQTLEGAASVENFEKAVKDLNRAFKEQDNLSAGFKSAVEAYTGVDTEILKVTESMGKMGQEVYKINSQFEDSAGIMNRVVFEYDSYTGQLVKTKSETKGLKEESQQLGDSFQGLFQHLSATSMVMRGFYQSLNKLREGVTFVGDVNDQLTQLAIVQNTSFNEAALQMEGMQVHADNLNRSLSEVLDTSVNLARQGLGQGEVETRMEAILKLASVARMSVEDATKAITVGVNAMGQEVDRTGDVLLRASQKAATDVEGLAQGFSVSAASAHALGMTIEETSAMIAVLTERTQLAETRVGNALKTMLARFNQIKAGDLGKDELNQVQEAIEGIAGIDFTDANGQIRSMYDILGELAEVWDTLEQNQQAAIATAAGGTHMQQFFYALMDGYEDVIALSDDLVNATGDVDRAYNTWMSSSEAATKKLTNAWEQFSLGIIDGGALANLKEMLAVIIQLADKMGAFNILAGGAFATFAINAKKGTSALAEQQGIWEKLSSTQKQYKGVADALNQAQTAGAKDKLKFLGEELSQLKLKGDAEQKQLLASVNLQEKLRFLFKGQVQVGEEIITVANAGSTALTRNKAIVESLTISFATLGATIKSAMMTLLPIMAMSAGAALISKYLTSWIGGLREAREEAAKLAHEIQNGTMDGYSNASEKTLNNLQDEIVALQRKKDAVGLNNEEMTTYTNLSNQLGDLIPNLVAGEDEHGNKLLDKTRLYGDLNEEMKENNRLQAQQKVKNFQDDDIGGKAFRDQAKDINNAIKEVRRSISESADDIAIVEAKFGDSLGRMKARMTNEEFVLKIKEMGPEEWAQLSASTQARIREMMAEIDQIGRMTAEQTYHAIMAELGTVPPEIAAMLQNPEMQGMIQESIMDAEAAGIAGYDAAGAWADGFSARIINEDSGTEELLAQYNEVGEQIAEIQEQVRTGAIETKEIEEEYIELKRDRLELMGEMAGLSEDAIANQLDQIDNTGLLRDLYYEIRDAQGDINEGVQENLVDNFQDLRSELEELNNLSIDLANAGEDWGVTMAEAMNNVIAKFPHMAELYGDQEAMLLALSNTHDNVANHYIDALMTMVLGEQTRAKMSGESWMGLVQLMANGMTKNLQNDEEWGKLKGEFHEALIKALAGAWADFYQINEDGLVILSKSANDHLRKLSAEVDSANSVRETKKRAYESLLAGGSEVSQGAIDAAYAEYKAASENYIGLSVNLYDTKTEMWGIQDSIQKSIDGSHKLYTGVEELSVGTNKINGAMNNVNNSAGAAMDKVNKMNDKAGGAGDKANKGGKKAAKGAKEATKATDEYTESIKRNNDLIDKAKEKLEGLKEAQDKVKQSIKQTEDEMKKLEKEYADNNASLEWTYGNIVDIIKQQKKDLLDRENNAYKKDRSLLADGTDPTAKDPFKIVNPDNVKSNIADINKAYDEMTDSIAKARAKEDEARQKAWDDELAAIEKANKAKTDALAKELEALQKIRSLEEYRKNLQEKQKNIGKLAARVEDYGLDDSLHGQSAKVKAQEDLQAAQKDYVDYIADREFQNILDLYNSKMQLLEQENQYRYKAAAEDLEMRKKVAQEELMERRKVEDKMRQEKRDAAIQDQNRRLELLEISHNAALEKIEKEYSQKQIYIKANEALITKSIKTIDGEVQTLYKAITKHRKDHEDGWSVFQHKREEETKNHLKRTNDAIDKLGVDSNNHLKNWSVESDETYKKLKANLKDLNKQHEALVERQKKVNGEIKDLQQANKDLKKAQDEAKKAGDAAKRSAEKAEAAVQRARGSAAGLANNLSRINDEFRAAKASGERMKKDIVAQTHTNIGLKKQQQQLHDQNEIERKKVEAEKRRKAQLKRDKEAAKRNDTASTGRQGGSFGQRTYSKFADGGVVTHTGPAIVHGSKAAPEYVFNTPQMKALADMVAGRSTGRGSLRRAIPLGQESAGIYAENFIKIDGNADVATVRQLRSTGQDMLQKFEQVMRGQGKGLRK